MRNEEIGVGFISCGGRATGLMNMFNKIDGVNIAGLCDPDKQRLAAAKKRYPKALAWTDLRALIEDDSIDAVVIATCNHWHCLAAIWAMQAGKDVYVEKPLSHSQWERGSRPSKPLGSTSGSASWERNNDPIRCRLRFRSFSTTTRRWAKSRWRESTGLDRGRQLASDRNRCRFLPT